MEKSGGNRGPLLSWGKRFGDESGQLAALDAVVNDFQGMGMIFFRILKMVERTEKKDHLPCPADTETAYSPMEIVNLHPPGKMHGIDHLQEPGGKNRILAKNLDNLAQGIIGFLENGFQFMHHRRKRGKPLPVIKKIPAFTHSDP